MPTKTPPAKPVLTPYDGHWIDPDTYRQWGLSFVKPDGWDIPAGQAPEDSSGIISKETAEIRYDFGTLAKDFARLKALAKHNGHDLRFVPGTNRSAASCYFIVEDNPKRPNESGYKNGNIIDLIQKFDSIWEINPQSEDDKTIPLDQEMFVYGKEYYEQMMVEFGKDGANKALSQRIVSAATECHTTVIALEEAARKLDASFDLDTITEKEITDFLEARSAYEKAFKNLRTASRPDAGESDAFSDKVLVFE